MILSGMRRRPDHANYLSGGEPLTATDHQAVPRGQRATHFD